MKKFTTGLMLGAVLGAVIGAVADPICDKQHKMMAREGARFFQNVGRTLDHMMFR